ncbi:hypothetical protein ASJ79_22765 [Mycobacterium sp. NAZ190054]|nr:hypothetical protein ASJ79_22765 [Mycobacterium sp. NAZ190054]
MAGVYQDTRERITELLTATGPAAWGSPVDACPGWTVRDVVSHMTAVAQDWADGSLAGVPTDAQTAEHVRRFDAIDETALLGTWSDMADRLARRARDDGLEPPLGDIACHEHDIRTALGRPGAREEESVRWTADQVLSMLSTPAPLRVVVEDAQYRSGPADGNELVLRTTRFEALRWRLGRRSRSQLAAMDWSADPAPVLAHLCLFGPASSDVVE